MVGDADVDGGFVDVDVFLMVGLSVYFTVIPFLRAAAERRVRFLATFWTRSSGVYSSSGIPAVTLQIGLVR